MGQTEKSTRRVAETADILGVPEWRRPLRRGEDR
jgi:hypothetical protein